MKKPFFFLFFLSSSLAFYAQSLSYEDLGILFSEEDYRGTARFNAMAGAFGALGGDVSALYGNPAGGAVFNHNELSGSLSIHSTETKSRYYGTQTQQDFHNFRIPQLGAVFVFDNPNQNSNWQTLAIGFAYNHTKDHSNTYRTEGNSEFASFTKHPNDERTPESTYELGIKQDFTNDLNGHASVFSFSFSGSYRESLYLGASLNGHQVELLQNAFLLEENSGESGERLFGEDNQWISEMGEGFSLGFGLIAKPTSFLRIGLAYQSPVWYYNIAEESNVRWNEDTNLYEGDIRIETSDLSGVFYDTAAINFWDYALRTPSKMTTSMACVLQKYGLISIDYSLQNYQNIELQGRGNFSQENRNYDMNLKEDVRSLRIGTEWRIKNWTLRGGFAHQDSPFQDTNALSNKQTYGLGLGVRMQQSKFDLSYETATRNDIYNFYAQFDGIEPAQLELNPSKITATFSFFF